MDEKLIKEAENGDYISQNELALKYQQDKQFKEALYWFTKAAEQEYDEAQFNLAEMYGSGQSGAFKLLDDYIYISDKEQYFKWATRAAKQGNPKFQEKLAWSYEKSDPVKYKYWATKASEQGYVKAQSYLGWAYYYDVETGKGVPEDIIKGVYWATRAAEQGDSGSQNFITRFYLKGEKNIKNYELSLLFKKAADLAKDGHYDQAETTWSQNELWKYHEPNLEL